MKSTVILYNIFKIIEWILFIGFTIIAVWFASGVLEQFFLHRTSFSQYEKEITNYPVITVQFNRMASEVNLTNVIIRYDAEGIGKGSQILKIGENLFHNKKRNVTQSIILESLENLVGFRVFRIIHRTPILGRKLSNVYVRIFTKFEEKTMKTRLGPSDVVYFFLTSLENSPGFAYSKWKDGKKLKITMIKDNIVEYTVQPQLTKYLKQAGKCQEESYYKCITSQLDTNKFIECPKKCIPNVFSNLDNNYSSPYCQNDTINEKCINNYIKQKTYRSNCKRSCSNLEYFGELEISMPYQPPEIGNRSFYQMNYIIDKEMPMKVYEEYITIDAISMIGSVGGTLGLFIGFSFSNVINIIVGYLQLFIDKIYWKNSAIMDPDVSKIEIGKLTNDTEYQHKFAMMEIQLLEMQKAMNNLKPIDEVKPMFTKN